MFVCHLHIFLSISLGLLLYEDGVLDIDFQTSPILEVLYEYGVTMSRNSNNTRIDAGFPQGRIYPIKYAYGCVVLCCVVTMSSVIYQHNKTQ